MLRLIITAVLASACLAYPQRREGAPAEAANLQGFDQGMQGMPNMQGMGMQPMQQMQPGMGGQMLPFNPNFALGYKRALDENLEKRREHSMFNGDNKSPFDSGDSLGNFMNFMKDNGNSLPFADMDNGAPDLDNFQPSAENEDGKFRFFDQQQ